MFTTIQKTILLNTDSKQAKGAAVLAEITESRPGPTARAANVLVTHGLLRRTEKGYVRTAEGGVMAKSLETTE